MRRFTHGVAKYLVYPLIRALAVYGQFYAPVCPFPPVGAMGVTEGLYPRPLPPRQRPAKGLVGPQPGHPERLRPDLLLTDFEREVLRQLDRDTAVTPVD
ncbi:DUF6059 family protein [Streptacidiphilus sp. PAMC 29251]